MKMMKYAVRWMIFPPVTGPVSIFLIRLLPGVLSGYEGIANLMMAGSGADGAFTFVFAISALTQSLFLAGGLFTRIASILVIIHTMVAVFVTGGITCCNYAQTMAGFFLVIEGPGRWSLDFYIATQRQPIFKINQNK